MDDTRTVRLATPIQAHGETLQEVVVRKPRARDLRGMSLPFGIAVEEVHGRQRVSITSQLGGDEAIAWAARLCDVPPSSVEQMEVPDLVQVLGAALGFFGLSLPTGPTS